MLSDVTAMPTLPTADLDRARAFYEGVLGFVPGDDLPEGVRYRAGHGAVLVYPSQYAGTNQATALGFEVDPDRFDEEVSALRAAGVSFDTFEWEGVVWEDGVASMEGGKAVWFRDPDGNILNLMAPAS